VQRVDATRFSLQGDRQTVSTLVSNTLNIDDAKKQNHATIVAVIRCMRLLQQRWHQWRQSNQIYFEGERRRGPDPRSTSGVAKRQSAEGV